jgi:hypothetical protein
MLEQGLQQDTERSQLTDGHSGLRFSPRNRHTRYEPRQVDRDAPTAEDLFGEVDRSNDREDSNDWDDGRRDGTYDKWPPTSNEDEEYTRLRRCLNSTKVVLYPYLVVSTNLKWDKFASSARAL